MKSRIRVVAPPEIITTVVRGDAEIGFDQMSNVAIDPRVEPIGVLPNGIQHYTNYVGGIVSESMQEESARALIMFLRSSSSQVAMKQKGFEPL
jgi:molybdate transport system substrate-binding protein